MEAVLDLFNSLINVFWSLLDVVVAFARVILPWLPLLGWIAFWSLAVNWVKAYEIIFRRGAWIGILLLMFLAVLVWGSVSPPVEGHHVLFGLTVSNFVGKFMYVAMLTCIAFLCGSAQLSGTFGSLCCFDEEAVDEHAVAH